MSSHFDVLIIGGGQAGVPLAERLASGDRHVGLVERKFLGGTCVNYGCTPTKAAIASARVAHLARRGRDYGLRIPHVEVDFPAVLDRARAVLMASRSGIRDRLEGGDNPRLLRGHARFTGRDGQRFRLSVDETGVTADRVVLNVGARTRVPDIRGLDAVDFLHAGNWLDHRTLPENLLIAGGGYIGLEMGQFYRRMGSRVTIVQRGGQLVPHEDEDVARALRQVLEAEDVGVLLDHQVRAVSADGGTGGGGLRVTLEDGDGAERDVAASHLFVAVGRRPNTDDLGLDAIGLAPDGRGYIDVDERLRTGVEGVWAAGDVRGGPMFTHTSWDDYRVLFSQLDGDGARTTERVVPYAVFTDPELGRVGMTEREAREAGRPVRVGRYEMKRNGKANELGETDGFVKVVVDAETDRLLGAAVVAVEGAELIHAYIDLMNAGAPYTAIENAVHIHPTLSEALQSVFDELTE